MKDHCQCKHSYKPCDGFYGLGMIGALIYFFQTSTGFGEKLLAILKAMVWPAFAVYELMKFLKM